MASKKEFKHLAQKKKLRTNNVCSITHLSSAISQTNNGIVMVIPLAATPSINCEAIIITLVYAYAIRI